MQLRIHIANPTDNTVSISASAGTQLYAWSVSGSATTVSANTYKTFSIATPDYTNAFNKKIWVFDYAGAVKAWSAPHTGTYKLQVWGAAGGGWGNHAATPGGYSYGNKTLNASSSLFVCVGGTGKGAGIGSLNSYNGGGVASTGGGGGASHIATSNYGVLSGYSSHQSDVLIVAGGGGSNGGQSQGLNGTTTCHGGFGGGTTGGWSEGSTIISYWNTSSSGTRLNADVGATQSRTGAVGVKGAFGQGGNGVGNGGCGGGGWYGGSGAGGNGLTEDSGGGGGSGYVGGCESPRETLMGTIWGSTTFESTSGSTEKGHIGNGYAKITLSM